MAELQGYLSPDDKQTILELPEQPLLFLDAFTVQGVVKELISDYCSHKTPKEVGFKLHHVYDKDPTKTSIFLDIGYNWRASEANKRPAIFVTRGDNTLHYPIIGDMVDNNHTESEEDRLIINQMQINIMCIGTNLGVTEQLAQYVKQPLVQFRKEIMQDFRFQRFRLTNVSPPRNIVEPKDHFVVELKIETAWAEGWCVKGDHLKIESISQVIFHNLTNSPITAQ